MIFGKLEKIEKNISFKLQRNKLEKLGIRKNVAEDGKFGISPPPDAPSARSAAAMASDDEAFPGAGNPDPGGPPGSSMP